MIQLCPFATDWMCMYIVLKSSHFHRSVAVVSCFSHHISKFRETNSEFRGRGIKTDNTKNRNNSLLFQCITAMKPPTLWHMI